MSDETAEPAGVEPAAPEPVAEAKPEAKAEAPRSARDAVARALRQVEREETTREPEPEAEPEKAEKPARDAKEAKPVEKAGREDGRDDSGRFKAKDEGTRAQPDREEKPEAAKAEKGPDAPARFSPDAKAAWRDAPAPVKAEVQRAIKELEGGISQYQAEFNKLKPFMEEARRRGGTIEAALADYHGIIAQMERDPVATLRGIAQRAGVDLRQLVQGQPEQPSDPHIQRIMQHNQALERQLAQQAQVLAQMQQRAEAEARMSSANQTVQEFAAAHPRFDELSGRIAELISREGMTLEWAYRVADMENPPAPGPDAALLADQEKQAAQTRAKASLSVAGHPTGSNPASKPKSSSAAEAARNALKAVGF